MERRQPISHLSNFTHVNGLLAQDLYTQVYMQFRKQAFCVEGFFSAWQNVWHVKGTEELQQLQQQGGTATWTFPVFCKWWVNVRMFWIDLSVLQEKEDVHLLQVALAHISCSQRFTKALSTVTVLFNFCRNLVWGRKLMGLQLWKPTSVFVYERKNQASLSYLISALQI